MQKNKMPPRKKKRVVKKIIFLSLLASVVLILVTGMLYYLVEIKFKKPLYVSPLPLTHPIQQYAEEQTENELEKALKKGQIDYLKITKEDNSYIVLLQNGSKIRFSPQKDILTQIASLQYILSHLTMEGRQFSSLDLRFDKPVIVIK